MAAITSPQSLGIALRLTRKRLGLTQADLALAAGVGLRFIVELDHAKVAHEWWSVQLVHALLDFCSA